MIEITAEFTLCPHARFGLILPRAIKDIDGEEKSTVGFPEGGGVLLRILL
jgi:hypothetical protein